MIGLLDDAPDTASVATPRARRRLSAVPSSFEARWRKHVLSCVAGDHDALAALYDQSSRLVYSVIMGIVRNAADAEEVTIDVYMQVWKSASRYDASRGGVGAWLVTIARSRAIDRLRACRLRLGSEAPEADAPPPVCHRCSPHALAELTELRGRVRAALRGLSPDERELVTLAFFEGLTHSELAGRLQQPLGTVKGRLRTGLLKLRARLGT